MQIINYHAVEFVFHFDFFLDSSCKQFFSNEGMSIIVKLLAENQVAIIYMYNM